MESQYYEDYEEVEIDIKELIGVVLKRLWIITIVAIATAILAFVASRYWMTPQYESTTKVYILSTQDNGERVTYSDLQAGGQLTKDYMSLVKSRPILEGVISDLNLDTTANALAEQINISSPDNTRIINITVRYNNPQAAKLIADSVRETSADHIKDIMDLEEVNIVEEGNVSKNQVSPNVLQNTLIGAILGGIIATLVILVAYFLDDTIKTVDDVEKYLGLSVLGSIPLQEGETASRKKKKSLFNKQQRKSAHTVRRRR